MEDEERSKGAVRMVIRRWLENDEAAFLMRALLGLVLIAASLGKLGDTNAFAAAIGNYKMSVPAVALTAATVIPWLEILCGLALLVGVFHKGASAIVIGMMIVFTSAIVAALIRGLDISCGCFSLDPESTKINWLKIVENSLYLVMAVYVYAARNSRHTLEDYLQRTHDRL